jgi:urease beta subunit
MFRYRNTYSSKRCSGTVTHTAARDVQVPSHIQQQERDVQVVTHTAARERCSGTVTHTAARDIQVHSHIQQQEMFRYSHTYSSKRCSDTVTHTAARDIQVPSHIQQQERDVQVPSHIQQQERDVQVQSHIQQQEMFRYSHTYSSKTTQSEFLWLTTKTRLRFGLEWNQTPDSPALGKSTVPIPIAVLGSHPSDGHFK